MVQWGIRVGVFWKEKDEEVKKEEKMNEGGMTGGKGVQKMDQRNWVCSCRITMIYVVLKGSTFQTNLVDKRRDLCTRNVFV